MLQLSNWCATPALGLRRPEPCGILQVGNERLLETIHAATPRQLLRRAGRQHLAPCMKECGRIALLRS